MLQTHKNHHSKVKLYKLILHFSFMNSFCVCGEHLEQCWKHRKCLLLSSWALTPGKLHFTFFHGKIKGLGMPPWQMLGIDQISVKERGYKGEPNGSFRIEKYSN